MAAPPSALETVLERDRRVVIVGLATVMVAAWTYTLAGIGMPMSAFEMTAGGGAMARAAWSPAYAVAVFFMWWIMMIAMMLPSAGPTILLYAAVNRKSAARGRPGVPAGVFAVGYLTAWAGFSGAAAGLHWALERAALLSPMMATASVLVGGGLLIAAGLYQLTPLKHACLRHCRAPIQFLTTRWRPGRTGAFRMGLEHGAFCLGCCWVLMVLLFYGGVMNLYWIAGLALFVLVEKLAPIGHWLSFGAAGGLIAWGGWVLFTAA